MKFFVSKSYFKTKFNRGLLKMRFIVFVIFIFGSMISCTPKEGASSANPADPAGSSGNTVTVLCKCDGKYISWQGETEELAKAGAEKNCESLSLSVSSCQKVK